MKNSLGLGTSQKSSLLLRAVLWSVFLGELKESSSGLAVQALLFNILLRRLLKFKNL